MTPCRVCLSPDTAYLWPDPQDGAAWVRCRACGSDSADREYDPTLYDADYVVRHHGLGNDLAAILDQLRSNLDWFGHHARGGGRDFLDVGHNEGAALTGMQDRGWSVHGFDVNPAADLGPHTTIAPAFRADLFPRQYDAVLCREVVEHVPDWRDFLGQLAAVTRPGGLVQVQTPRPWHEPHPTPYQRAHLQLFAPPALRRELERVGLSVIEDRQWLMGQAWLCRR
jgi:SAM-dependent methyltransferase